MHDAEVGASRPFGHAQRIDLAEDRHPCAVSIVRLEGAARRGVDRVGGAIHDREGYSCRTRSRKVDLLPEETSPCSPLASCFTGTNVMPAAEALRTSCASGCPERGKVLLVSSLSTIVLSGSTSARTASPGEELRGIFTFHELASRPSSRRVGVDDPAAGIVSVPVSAPSRYSRTRTLGAAVFASFDSTKTRR